MRRSTYAIWWHDGDGPKHIGKVEVGGLHALLSGNGSGRLAVALDQILAVDYVRGQVLVTRKRGPIIRIGSLDAPGALRELACRLVASGKGESTWRV